jgi:hypothetical protein
VRLAQTKGFNQDGLLLEKVLFLLLWILPQFLASSFSKTLLNTKACTTKTDLGVPKHSH